MKLDVAFSFFLKYTFGLSPSPDYVCDIKTNHRPFQSDQTLGTLWQGWKVYTHQFGIDLLCTFHTFISIRKMKFFNINCRFSDLVSLRKVAVHAYLRRFN